LNDKVCTYKVGVNTYGVAVDTNGDVYASCNGQCGFIQVFDNNGTPTYKIVAVGIGQLDSPRGLLIVGETLYVTDIGFHRVQMFSTTTSQYIDQFGSNGSGEGQFNQPRGMAYDGKGHILVADCGNGRVQVFTIDGTFVQVIKCNLPPQDVAVNNNGDIHVVSPNQNTIQVFSSSGAPKNGLIVNNNYRQVNYAGRYYDVPTSTCTLLGIIAIDDLGQQLVISNNQCLHVFDATGDIIINNLLRLQNATGIALDKDGNVYIADYYSIHKI
jgi:sulfur carrier protein ThiS